MAIPLSLYMLGKKRLFACSKSLLNNLESARKNGVAISFYSVICQRVLNHHLLHTGQTSNLENGFKNSNYGVGHIVLGLYAGLWSYAGWDILNYGTPEIRKPERYSCLELPKLFS